MYNMKKKLTGFLLVLSLIAANLLTAGTAKAASLDTYQGNAPSSIVLFTYGTSATTGKVQTIRTKKIPSYAKQVKAVSANKKIATVSVQKNKYGKSYYYAFEITAHQAGTTKVKLTANVKGKQVTDYTNVKVVKYQNPVSGFKIGSKEYASKFSKYPASNVKANFTNKETKIKCVPAKGWTVKKIDIMYEVTEDCVASRTASAGSAVNDIATLPGTKYLMPTKNAVGAKVTAVLYNAKLKKTVNLSVKLI